MMAFGLHSLTDHQKGGLLGLKNSLERAANYSSSEACWELAAYTKADRHRKAHHLDLPALSFFGFAQSLIIIRHVLSFLEI